MTDYISREAAYPIAKKVVDAITNGEYHAGVFAYDIMDWIDDIPAADVRPVVKAKWEWKDNNGYYYCGNCKAVSPREDQDGEYIDCPNFCPNCGAVMREEQDGR